jgi:tRNA(Ile)-lysidine synthase
MLAHVGDGGALRGAELNPMLALPEDAPRRSLGGCLVTPEGRIRRISREPSACPPPGPLGAIWDRRWRIDGPDAPTLTVGALGRDIDGLDWRDTGLPRLSAMATPAIRDEGRLLASPVLSPGSDWSATLVGPSLSATIRPARGFFN